VVDRAETADIPLNRNIIGRIGEHHRGALLLHQERVCGLVLSACAKDPVPAKQPETARTTYARADLHSSQYIGRVFLFFSFGFEAFDAQSDG